jgi:hypothetical protein
MRWVGHTAQIGEMRSCRKFWSLNLKGRHHMGDLGMILKWIWDNRVRNGGLG